MINIKVFEKFKERFSSERISVGLDIGTHTVKIIKLRFNKDIVELCGFAVMPTEIDLEQVIRNITKAQEATRVNISFCGPATIIRYGNLLKMNQNELKQALKFEAQKHIPFPVAEVNLDGCILKSDSPDNKMLVLIAAAKKEFMNGRLKLIEGSGIKVNLADIDSLALINAFNFNYLSEESAKNKVIALLNVGAAQSNLDILENGTPRLSRDIPCGGNNFSQKISDSLGIDPQEAEKLKLNTPGDKVGKMAVAVEPILTHLASEVRLSFDYYESQSTASVTKIFLSGGSSKLGGIKEKLASLLGIEVDLWDPLHKIVIDAELDNQKLKETANQLAVAVGLALRS